MSRIVASLAVALFSIVTGGCGGNKTVDTSCDKPQPYQRAEETKRVEVPDDLDPLDEFREMPVPDAAPRAPRPEGSPCIDRPPRIRLVDGEAE